MEHGGGEHVRAGAADGGSIRQLGESITRCSAFGRLVDLQRLHPECRAELRRFRMREIKVRRAPDGTRDDDVSMTEARQGSCTVQPQFDTAFAVVQAQEGA